MNKYTTALLKEIEDYSFESELYQFLAGFFIDKIEVVKLFDIITKNASKIPFDILLELMHALFIPLPDIEKSWDVPGFNDWYKETHGQTVWDGDLDK